MYHPIPGLHHTPFLTNREIFSLHYLPESLVILGGGPIGIEMAQAFNRLGTRVTVVDRSDQILGKEDKDMADTVAGVMEAEGVTFFLAASIEEVLETGGRKQIKIIDRAGESILPGRPGNPRGHGQGTQCALYGS